MTERRDASETAAVEYDDDLEVPCWCGEKRPYFSDLDLARGCAGTGYLDCLCGGDFCLCHNHGEIECQGCEDCGEVDEYE